MRAMPDQGTDTIARGTEDQIGPLKAGVPRGLLTLVSDFAAVLGSRIASLFLSLATVVVTTRLLGPTGYAQVTYVVVIATLVFVAGAAWTGSAVVRYGREEFDATGTMRVVTWERAVITVPALGAAAGLAFLVRAADLMPKSVTWTLAGLAIAYGFALAISDHVVYALQAIGRMKLSAWAVVLRQGIVVAAIATLFVFGVSVSPAVVASVMVGGWLVTTAAAAVPAWRHALWPPDFAAKVRRQILRFSWPLVAFTTSQYVISTIDLLVLAIYRSDAQVGIYALAYRGYTVLQSIGMAAGTVLLPLFVSLRRAGRDPAIAKFAERIVPQLTFLTGTLLGMLAPFMTLIVPAVFGRAFRDAALPMTILFIPLALSVTCYLQATIIVLHEETRRVGAISVAAALVNVVGDFVLIGPAGMGGIGAAVATAVAMFVLVAGYARIVARCTGTRPPTRAVILLAPLAVGTILSLGRSGWESAVLVSAVTGIVAAGLIRAGWVFKRSDAEFLSHVRLPETVRRALVRSILTLSRA
jgi:O-antigen/teichoic acid export membrane protein